MAVQQVKWVQVGCSTGGQHWSFNPQSATVTEKNTVVAWVLSSGSRNNKWTFDSAQFTSGSAAKWNGTTPGPIVGPNNVTYGYLTVDFDSQDGDYNFTATLTTSSGTYTSPDPQIENEPPPYAFKLKRRIRPQA